MAMFAGLMRLSAIRYVMHGRLELEWAISHLFPMRGGGDKALEFGVLVLSRVFTSAGGGQ